MSKEGPGKIIKISKNAKTRYISVPSMVASDDRFPFAEGEEIRVMIDPEKKRLIIEKSE